MVKHLKPIPKKLYQKIVKVLPRVTVSAIIKDGRGVLLTKRNIPPCKGCWVLPGRVVEFKDRLTEAAEKEAREETGLKVRAVKYLGYYDDPKRVPGRQSIEHSFVCKIVGGQIRPNPEEVSEIRFFKKFPKKMGFDHRKILQDYLKWKKAKGTFWSSK